MIKATIASGQKPGDEVTARDERLSNSGPDLRFNWLRGRPLSAHPSRSRSLRRRSAD